MTRVGDQAYDVVASGRQHPCEPEGDLAVPASN